MLSKLLNHDEAEVYAYLHKNLDPAITMAIDVAKFPGLKEKTIEKIEGCFRYKFITIFQDKLKTEWHTLHKVFSTIGKIWKLLSYQIDLIKDTILTASLLIIIGGPAALYHFPTNFSSVIVIIFAGTIIVPLLMSSIQLVIQNPYLIFLFSRTTLKFNKWMMNCVCLILSPFNHILLELNFKEANDKVISLSKEFYEDEENNVLKHVDDCKMIKFQLVEILKLNFGLETLYQFVLQLILLLFTRTSTPTIGGLESFFEKNTFFGIQFDPMIILSISAAWSLKTCILLHVKAVRVEKGFFRFKPTIIVLLWAFFGTIRRVGSLVAYFSPSMGLFSLLHHWQAENLPFTARLEMTNTANNSNDIVNAKVSLYNMTEEISWPSLDRWNYDDPQHPLPPPYSMYTGLSLQQTFVWFIGLFIFQIFLLLGVKV